MPTMNLGLTGYKPTTVPPTPPKRTTTPGMPVPTVGYSAGSAGGGEWLGALKALQGATQGPASYGTVAGAGRVEPPAPVAREAAPAPSAQQPSMSRGFAKAKDASSRIGNQALQALRSEMVGRGIEGSGVEGRLTGNILGDVAAQQSDAAYQQSKMADEQAWEGAKLGYQGAVQQRGQDTGLAEAGYSGQISQRGQDIGQQSAWASALPAILQFMSANRAPSPHEKALQELQLQSIRSVAPIKRRPTEMEAWYAAQMGS